VVSKEQKMVAADEQLRKFVAKLYHCPARRWRYNEFEKESVILKISKKNIVY
jgi:hypothetical protein